MPATYEPIATTTLGSAASTITFSSISGSYTDLRLVLIGTATSSGSAPRVRFNSDTGTNYSYTILIGDPAFGAFSQRGTNNTFVNLAVNTNWDNVTPQARFLDIFSYSGSTNKTILSAESADLNGSGSVSRAVYLWRNTGAITSIELSLNANQFATGTTATLYGILKA